MVDSAGNPFGNAREHNSISTGYGPPSMPVFAKMLTNARITSEDHEQDVRHIELDLGSSVRVSVSLCELVAKLK
jgi:sulfite reductase alpha subunit-like flavoprotein